eukprot:2526552-Prymnesium_polylepis.3
MVVDGSCAGRWVWRLWWTELHFAGVAARCGRLVPLVSCGFGARDIIQHVPANDGMQRRFIHLLGIACDARRNKRPAEIFADAAPQLSRSPGQPRCICEQRKRRSPPHRPLRIYCTEVTDFSSMSMTVFLLSATCERAASRCRHATRAAMQSIYRATRGGCDHT